MVILSTSDQPREDGRDDRPVDLDTHQQLAPVDAVGDDTCGKAREDGRHAAGQAHEAEVERHQVGGVGLLCELDDEPAEAKLLHRRADVANHLADPDESVIAEGEGRQGGGEALFPTPAPTSQHVPTQCIGPNAAIFAPLAASVS